MTDTILVTLRHAHGATYPVTRATGLNDLVSWYATAIGEPVSTYQQHHLSSLRYSLRTGHVAGIGILERALNLSVEMLRVQ